MTTEQNCINNVVVVVPTTDGRKNVAVGSPSIMDPPRPQKSRRGEKASNRPFYATEGQTSANIVAEARSSIRPLDTKRPFTPVESNRTLFGGSSVKPYEGRPPSAFR